ncbi:MAG: GAF domain-containing protein, partial [Anaerolineales bacterium]
MTQSPNPNSLRSQIAGALFRPHPSLTDLGEKRQARLIAILSLFFGLFNLLGVIAILIRGNTALEFNEVLIDYFGLTAVLLLSYSISRTKYYRVASYLIPITLALTAIIGLGDDFEVSRYVVAYGALGLIIAGTVLPTAQVIAYAAVMVIGTYIIPLYNPNYTRFGADGGFLLVIGVLTVAFKVFRDNLERDRLAELQKINQELRDIQEGLETRVKERTAELEMSNQKAQRRANQLQAVTNISRAISTIQDLEKLLPAITQAISRGFDIYHVGIFLLDKRGEYAELRAANSEGGQRMLARHHRLRVGEEGIIGYVTKYGRARIALDVGEDAVFFNNPDLPNTHSEIGLPLIIGGNVIGALDVQSEQPNAFSPEDINALAALANQVSIAIQNADLFSQVQKSAEEIERAYREFVRQEWQKITPTIENLGYVFTPKGTVPLTETPSSSKESGIFTVPVTLRGETIGELGIRTRENTDRLNPDEIAILRATADRVALA